MASSNRPRFAIRKLPYSAPARFPAQARAPGERTPPTRASPGRASSGSTRGSRPPYRIPRGASRARGKTRARCGLSGRRPLRAARRGGSRLRVARAGLRPAGCRDRLSKGRSLSFVRCTPIRGGACSCARSGSPTEAESPFRARESRRQLRWFGHARQSRERHRELRFVVVLILQLAGEVVDVGLHVEVTVPAEIEQDRAPFPFLPAASIASRSHPDRVVSLGSGDDAFARAN